MFKKKQQQNTEPGVTCRGAESLEVRDGCPCHIHSPNYYKNTPSCDSWRINLHEDETTDVLKIDLVTTKSYKEEYIYIYISIYYIYILLNDLHKHETIVVLKMVLVNKILSPYIHKNQVLP